MLHWPYCLVWRPVADVYWKIPLGDDTSDLDPEAFSGISTIFHRNVKLWLQVLRGEMCREEVL